MATTRGEVMKQIADYAYLSKTQRSWHVWLGNPFGIGKYIIPLKKKTEKQIVKMTLLSQKKEKKRFTKLFPDVEWSDHGR